MNREQIESNRRPEGGIMTAHRRPPNIIEEFLENQEDEEYVEYAQVRVRDDLDRMDEEDVELLHVEEV